jgi:GntR family transcriptional regulator
MSGRREGARTPSFKYAAVRDALAERIRSLDPGTMLPPEASLCREYGVSRITLRKAVDHLVERGVLVREQGRGTFTSEPTFEHKNRESFVQEIPGFYADMTRRGFVVGTTVLQQRLVPAPRTVGQELRLMAGERVVEIERLRTVDGAVNHLVRTYLPARLFRDVVDLDLDNASLYDHIRSTYGTTMHRARFVAEVQVADEAKAEILGVEVGSPLLVVHSTVRDEAGEPVVHGTSWLLPENNQVEFEVVATPPSRNAEGL